MGGRAGRSRLGVDTAHPLPHARPHSLAEDMKKNYSVIIAKVDCTKNHNKDLCKMYGIKSFPTLKYAPHDHAIRARTIEEQTASGGWVPAPSTHELYTAVAVPRGTPP